MRGDVLDIVGTGGDRGRIHSMSRQCPPSSYLRQGYRWQSTETTVCQQMWLDVLEALGVKIDIPVDRSEQILREIGICFLYAPMYHSSISIGSRTEKELGYEAYSWSLSSPANANLRSWWHMMKI